MKTKRKKVWWGLLVLGLALALALPFLRDQGRTEWAIAFDTANGGFYRITWEHANTNEANRKFVSNAYVIGVVKIFSRTDTPMSPTDTNLLNNAAVVIK